MWPLSVVESHGKLSGKSLSLYWGYWEHLPSTGVSSHIQVQIAIIEVKDYPGLTTQIKIFVVGRIVYRNPDYKECREAGSGRGGEWTGHSFERV